MSSFGMETRKAVLTFHRGFFGKGDMQKEFEVAAFNLQKGEVSGIVDTASGIHLIQRLVQWSILWFRVC